MSPAIIYWDVQMQRGKKMDDRCYECKGYGDDYIINDEGELECWCTQCPFFEEEGEQDATD